MKRLLLTLAIVLTPLAALAQTTPKKAPPVEQALLALEQRWATASKAGDGAAVGALLAEDFTSIDSDGSVRAKAETMERVTKGKWTVNALSEMKATVYDNAAVVTGVWTGVGTDGAGKPVDTRERWADTWIKKSGKWLCVASASAPAPAK